MRPPYRILVIVVVLSAALTGIAIADSGDSTNVEKQLVQSAQEPIVVENESTYQVSQTLQFEVDGSKDSYEVRTKDDDMIAELAVNNGTATLDTGSLDAGTYVLVHGPSKTVTYQFTLTASETTNTTTVTDDNEHSRTATNVTFDVSGKADAYELRTENGSVLVMELQANNGSVMVDTSELNYGAYVLVNGGNEEVVHQFTFTEERTTTRGTSTTTDQPTKTTAESIKTSEMSGTATTDSEKQSSTVPGFGLLSVVSAFASGLLLARRRT